MNIHIKVQLMRSIRTYIRCNLSFAYKLVCRPVKEYRVESLPNSLNRTDYRQTDTPCLVRSLNSILLSFHLINNLWKHVALCVFRSDHIVSCSDHISNIMHLCVSDHRLWPPYTSLGSKITR